MKRATSAPAGQQALPRRDLLHVVVNGERSWKALRGARVLITGGTGFVGRWLVESLLCADAEHSLGCTVEIVTRDVRAFSDRCAHIAGDRRVTIRPGDVLTADLSPAGATYVVHAAAISSARLNAQTPLEVFDGIVTGTRRSLEGCVGGGVKGWLLVSSGAVYGPQPADVDRLTEDFTGAPDPLVPRSAYGMAKRSAEYLAAEHARSRNVPAKIARCFAFTGPGLSLDGSYAVGNFLADALAGGPICVKGDGTAVRSYMYAADLALWLWTILTEASPGRAYNVGSPEPVTIAQLADTVARTASAELTVRIEGQKSVPPAAAGHRYVPDVARAAADLGLRPSIELADGLARTWRWLRGNGDDSE